MPYHVAVMLLGSGANGKSVFLGLIRALLGRRNVSAVTVQALVEHRFASAQLHGKLANICGDLDARAIKRSDVFKMATGGDSILAERKNQQPFEFVSFATQMFSANEAPISSDQSEAWFRRWQVVPFTRTFTPDQADPALLKRLTKTEELEGLLVRAVHALRELMIRQHFHPPESVREANALYRYRLDTVEAFVNERCVVHPNAWCARSALYNDYRTWITDGGRLALSNVTFYERLAHDLAGKIEERKRHGIVGFAGIGLTATWNARREF
jgi:putative DNA primase/helicase